METFDSKNLTTCDISEAPTKMAYDWLFKRIVEMFWGFKVSVKILCQTSQIEFLIERKKIYQYCFSPFLGILSLKLEILSFWLRLSKMSW